MLQKIKLPLIITSVFLIFILLWKILNLPSDEVLIQLAKDYFIKYGFSTVFLASLIEGMLMVGFYIPGGVVIFTGVILSAGNPNQAILSVSASIVGFILAYSFNYLLGKYGWYKVFVKFGMKNSLEEAREKFEKYSFKAIYMSYWQPNLGSLISTCAGILKSDFYKFTLHSILGATLWYSFWGFVTYLLGEGILSYLVFIFFGIMILWILSIVFLNKKDVLK